MIWLRSCGFLFVLVLQISICEEISVKDEELTELSEALFELDIPNQSTGISLNLQSKVKRNRPRKPDNDEATQEPPVKLDSLIANEPWLSHSSKVLLNVYKAYKEAGENKIRSQEDFLDTMVRTPVMKRLIQFMATRGGPGSQIDMRDYLKTIWFTVYKKGRSKTDGFRHVFMGQVKRRAVSGLHNWVYFLQMQHNITYLGYYSHIYFNEAPSSFIVIKYKLNNATKPKGSMLIGTSPELELALYTLCFFYRSNKDCRVTLKSEPLDIVAIPQLLKDQTAVIKTSYPRTPRQL